MERIASRVAAGKMCIRRTLRKTQGRLPRLLREANNRCSGALVQQLQRAVEWFTGSLSLFRAMLEHEEV